MSPTYLRKPHLIPKLPATFRDAIEAYAAELKDLAMKILSLLAKVLHMKDEEMAMVFEEGMQSIRMNYYPPCPQPKLVIGLFPHSDASGLTILLQVNEIKGLQIKKHGIWVPASSLPNAFIVNLGDYLEIVTNVGTYMSIEHRAIVNSVKGRISIATFFSPRIDREFGPLPSLVTSGTPGKFKNIGMADCMRGFVSKKLDGKSYLDLMRI